MSANENNKFHTILDALEETLTRLLRISLYEMLNPQLGIVQTLEAAQDMPKMEETYTTILMKVAHDVEQWEKRQAVTSANPELPPKNELATDSGEST